MPELSSSSKLDSILLHQEHAPLELKLTWLICKEDQATSWHQYLQSGKIYFILNLSGEGLILSQGTRLTLLPESISIFKTSSSNHLRTATRFASSKEHRFLVLESSPNSLGKIFPSIEQKLTKNLGMIRRWSQRDSQLYQDFTSPPVTTEGRRTWYQAKILELLSLHLFHEPSLHQPLFCTQLKNRTHKFVREALQLLEARLDEPLDLKDLAEDVGCAPHYLSRLVKQDTGKTLSLHLRSFRINKATELLAIDQNSVTDVSLTVGYSSLSHFSKAFQQEQGLSPSQFIKRKHHQT